MQEIERKFFLTRVPASIGDWTPLRQGCLAMGRDAEVRLGQRGQEFRLTCKRGQDLVREEHEVAITSERWDTLWPATRAARIEKRRGTVRIADVVAEIDVFSGRLDDSMLVEVEFEDVEAATAFRAPEWFTPR